MVEQCQAKPYEYWVAQEYPMAFQDTFDGHCLQVEISILELKEIYIHLKIAASNGMGWWIRCSTDFIIERIKK